MKVERDDRITLDLARAGVFDQATQQAEVGDIKFSFVESTRGVPPRKIAPLTPFVLCKRYGKNELRLAEVESTVGP